MSRELKVWGWQGSHRDATRTQARFIVAAPTKAAAARAAGEEDPRRLFNLGETRNDTEVAVATAAPGTVYWQDMNGYGNPWNVCEATS